MLEVIVGLIVCLVLMGVVAFLIWKSARSTMAVAQDQIRNLESERTKLREDWVRGEAKLERMEELQAELESAQQTSSELQEEVSQLRQDQRALQTQIEERERSLEEQRKLLDEARESLKESFEALSGEALRKNNQSFLEIAKEQLASQSKESAQELEKRRIAIETLVKPLTETLTEVKTQVGDLEKKRIEAYATLTEQVEGLKTSQLDLRRETKNLVNALRTPNQRGRWGELQLRRVVEMAGMINYVDFVEQDSSGGDDKLRPDMIVRLPGEKTIIVDAKAPLDSYIKAVEAPDDAQRIDWYKDHARQVRQKITGLSRKEYWNQFQDSPEMVIMFLPGEPIYSAALEQDPTLIEFGVENNILIATPMTLITLLRAAHYGWRQESLANDARKIAKAGADLYDRLSKMGEHLAKHGKHLENAMGSYNDFVGTIERRVFPSARELKKLMANNSLPEIEEPKQLADRARVPKIEELALPGLDD